MDRSPSSSHSSLAELLANDVVDEDVSAADAEIAQGIDLLAVEDAEEEEEGSSFPDPEWIKLD